MEIVFTAMHIHRASQQPGHRKGLGELYQGDRRCREGGLSILPALLCPACEPPSSAAAAALNVGVPRPSPAVCSSASRVRSRAVQAPQLRGCVPRPGSGSQGMTALRKTTGARVTPRPRALQPRGRTAAFERGLSAELFPRPPGRPCASAAPFTAWAHKLLTQKPVNGSGPR